MARSRVHRRKSHHKRKGSKRHRTRRHRSRRMRQRGGVGEPCNNNGYDRVNYKQCVDGWCMSSGLKAGPGTCQPFGDSA